MEATARTAEQRNNPPPLLKLKRSEQYRSRCRAKLNNFLLSSSAASSGHSIIYRKSFLSFLDSFDFGEVIHLLPFLIMNGTRLRRSRMLPYSVQTCDFSESSDLDMRSIVTESGATLPVDSNKCWISPKSCLTSLMKIKGIPNRCNCDLSPCF